ncbi:aldehyde dehydrogenase family protein [Alkalihalobacillus oceani]|uniref:Aldehyde dehydrogenase family protein n=1 Tax=Halalkalibacter oceani TaxID=1653776 RepID=A0A9X2DTX2_9BACI|nr:aldehyde dehydrogenase family protein [Halalkalibacter oceani]MCM3716298.1 aldehyde dehydrogenase family protein [Halalkalibacter oceani]
MKQVSVEQQLMLINGEWRASVSSEFFSIESPAERGSVIAEVPRSSAEDVDIAVKAAHAAFASWREVPAKERGKLLWRIADAVEEQAEDIARTIATETGNAIRTQARGEVKSVIEIFRYFAGVVSEIRGSTCPVDNNLMAYTQREPYGVVGAIVPWNAPVQLSSLKIAPAVAAGNTIVLKTAEDAPLGVLKLAKICAEYLPAGVVNVITGFGQECGEALTGHPLVNKLTFTGSTAVGKTIMRKAAERIVPVSLELGGKSPQIVFPDANNDKVVEGIISAMRFARQGQSCSAGTRLFLHESIFHSFVEKLVNRLGELKVGHPLDEESDMGSLINKKQFDKVTKFIEEGINDDNLELLIGGLPPQEGPLAEGYYHRPTLFACQNNNTRLAKEEIFGPVLLIMSWSDEEEVIKAANDSSYGLAAFVWTNDTKKALRTAGKIESGWIQVNRGGAQMPGLSYGGYKQSGIGREFSLEGMLDSYTQVKSIMIDFND